MYCDLTMVVQIAVDDGDRKCLGTLIQSPKRYVVGWKIIIGL